MSIKSREPAVLSHSVKEHFSLSASRKCPALSEFRDVLISLRLEKDFLPMRGEAVDVFIALGRFGISRYGTAKTKRIEIEK